MEMIENQQKVYIYYVYIQKACVLCKKWHVIVWVSYGYVMGILW